ncbi:hypothetical protein RDI58_024340 [Solanum bulbocastanum]|uniref:PPM-type phosphatase domain-containing protein n=1 Tax=Solanum bulbocastanum TaxID=147425 RepID=A0AAN8T1N1_SOLBU
MDTVNVTRRAYHSTDKDILEKAFELGKGGSTTITAMLINNQTVVVANVGDSRVVISKKGDVPRVDGQLVIARIFGDKSLKRHLSLDPNVAIELIHNDADLIIWQVMVCGRCGRRPSCSSNLSGIILGSSSFYRSRIYLVATELLLETLG